MTGRFRVPLDHPLLGAIENAHSFDDDPVTTGMAVRIADAAVAARHPADKDAARKALTGPPAAGAMQATLQPYLNRAVEHDKAADQHSTDAVKAAGMALEAANMRRDLPHRSVMLSDGSARTRAQMQAGHDQRLEAAAQRESRGDFEHYATPPGPLTRALVVVVLSVIEVFLLIWPVTNASLADPKSLAYVAGLVALFLFMNEQLPKMAGLAVRDAREARHAAWELTRIGLTAARNGDPVGRTTTGHVDERFVRATERTKILSNALFGAVVCVYAAVMFARVDRLARGLGWPLGFVLLAAALITAFTAGATIIMARWWARGNALGDQLREYGAITGQSRAIADAVAEESHAHAHASTDATHQARRELDLGEQVLHHGGQAAGIVLQKAAVILGQESVITPHPDNLIPAGRPIRDRALVNIGQAAIILAQAGQILNGPAPFHPDGPAPNPWQTRTTIGQAPPNPVFADPIQLGPLHTSAVPFSPSWRRHLPIAGLAVVVLTLATLAVMHLHG